MARNLRGIRGSRSIHPINLPEYLKDTPFLIQATQIWEIFDGEYIQKKPAFLKGRVSATGL
eukprot:12921801-Prorocentrum_lima.AAC.1